MRAADVPAPARGDLDKQAKAHSYMVQLLGGMETLKCAGAERLGLEKWSNLYTDELNIKMRRARAQAYTDGSAARSPRSARC